MGNHPAAYPLNYLRNFSVSHFSIRAFWALLAPLFAFSARAQLTLTDDSASRYQIVIASNAIPSERYAAEELQRYLEKISGTKLPIVTDVQSSRSREILLGDNARLEKLGGTLDMATLGPEGFVLLTKGDR